MFSSYSSNRNIEFGAPVVTNKLVNGSNAQSFNYIDNPALLSVGSNSANACSWNITGGNGSRYPNGFSCEAYAYNFVIIKAEVSNQCGSGDSFFFYLQRNGYSGYRMASANPTKDGKIIVEFEHKELAENFLSSILMYSESQKIVATFDGNEAKNQNYFKSKNQVEFDVTKFEKGTYFLHINIADKKYIERLIID